MICKSKLSLKSNKSAFIGMCILKLSKVLMYEFRYDYIKNKYDNKLKLLFTDTDRLMYEIKIKILAGIKKCLISHITRLGQNTMIIQSN